MLKTVFIFLIAALSYAQTPEIENVNYNPEQTGFLKGRHGIDLKIGIYDNANITSISTVEILGSNVITNSSTGFMGSIAYQYWFMDYLSFRIGAGALVTNVDSKVTTNVGPSVEEIISSEVATVVPVLAGVNFYPLQLTEHNSALPYISLYVGPYFGTYTKSEVALLQITQETIVESVFGIQLGGGFDMLIGDLFKLGISAGYHFMGDFNKPIGSETNYSGPSYSLVFGFIF